MQAFKKFQLTDDVAMQIIFATDEMMSARFWFTGKGFPTTHRHANQEVNVVVDGEFEAERGIERFPVRVGEVLVVGSDVEHNMKCLTPTGQMVSTWTPARQDLLKYAVKE